MAYEWSKMKVIEWEEVTALHNAGKLAGYFMLYPENNTESQIEKDYVNEYDAGYWKHGVNVTVGQFCDYLKKHIPPDAVFHVCGDSQVYLHFSPEGNVFSVDHDSLSDLPEYENCEIGELAA